ncbi:RNA polymerase sigma factor [Candidatus Palauibacter sp.]|uniref:RNA polymerase sigma factor n=1 Tax=Candidatus Palauibacter sp. TaxID=3101350 RepID=UPI003B01DC18
MIRLLYEEYADELFAVAHRLTESSAAAGDVLQDVFSELPEAMRGFDGERRIGPWLRTVTARAALKHLRSRRVRREISLASVPRALEGEPSPEGRVLDAIALERALSSLPDELRAVVVLKVVEGYSHGEIAELLGVARSTSEGRLFRARKLLRAALCERLGDVDGIRRERRTSG